MGIHQMLLFFAPIFLIMIFIERREGKKRGKSLYTRGDTMASVLIAIGQQLVGLLSLGIVVGTAMTFAWEYRLFELSLSDWCIFQLCL